MKQHGQTNVTHIKRLAGALETMCPVLALAVLFCAFPDTTRAAQHGESAKVDGVVAARVNGEPVTRAEVQRLLANDAERRRLLQEIGDEDPDSKELDRVALRKLINRRLILQEANRRNFIVTEQDVDKAVTALRRRFDDLPSLGVWMKEQGLEDKSIFESLRVEMLATRVRTALVESVRLTGEQAQQYYEAHKNDLKTNEVRLQVIVVKDEAAAKDILAALQKGADFGALALARSVGVRAKRGGDTGWINAETLGPPLRDAVRTMTVRQARGPLQKGTEWLIVRLGGRRAGRTKTLAEARPEIERRLLPAKQQEALQAWLTEQEKKSKIEVFLK
jgi:peptidyl-prolyl cis-trans isomerase SurA